MKNRNELETMTVNELLELAKEYNIKGRHKMKKSDLIENILTFGKSENENKCECNPPCEHCTCKENENNAEDEKVEILYTEKFNKNDGERKTKADYINNVKIGDIIIFNFEKDKATSAKATEIYRDTDGNVKTVICQSRKGTFFKVPVSKIAWVKTSRFLPHQIYEQLKWKSRNNSEVKFGE